MVSGSERPARQKMNHGFIDVISARAGGSPQPLAEFLPSYKIPDMSFSGFSRQDNNKQLFFPRHLSDVPQYPRWALQRGHPNRPEYRCSSGSIRHCSVPQVPLARLSSILLALAALFCTKIVSTIFNLETKGETTIQKDISEHSRRTTSRKSR